MGEPRYICFNCQQLVRGRHECTMSRPVEYATPDSGSSFRLRIDDPLTVRLAEPAAPDPRDARIADLTRLYDEACVALERMQSRAEKRDARIAELEAEVATARDTNRRLNARCQQYERALAEKIGVGGDGKPKGSSLSRALLNGLAEMQRAEIETMRAERLTLARALLDAATDAPPIVQAPLRDALLAARRIVAEADQ